MHGVLTVMKRCGRFLSGAAGGPPGRDSRARPAGTIGDRPGAAISSLCSIAGGGVLVTGILLRLTLAVVNTQANDDHISVIKVLAGKARVPPGGHLFEEFQPKLYHATVALAWRLSPWQSGRGLIVIAQMVSCAAGILTLFVVRRFLHGRMTDMAALLSFSLVALNPRLIGLSAQAANDSFVILFGTLAIAHGFTFFSTGGLRAFVVMSASATLAALSKGDGLPLFGAIVVVLVAFLARGSPVLPKRGLALLSAVFIVGFAVTVTIFGPYRANYAYAGNPFATSAPPDPIPNLLEPTYLHRPGTTSVVATYLTFRLVDMLRHPIENDDPKLYPVHRTSLWSQLYGRANFIQFEQHPPTWRNRGPAVLALGRLILVLALLPAALLVAGTARGSMVLVECVRSPRPMSAERRGQMLLAVSALAYCAFIVGYTLRYRDFSSMKPDFLFPALLAFIFFFGQAAQRLEDWSARMARLRLCAYAMFAALSVLYVADSAVLILQLA